MSRAFPQSITLRTFTSTTTTGGFDTRTLNSESTVAGNLQPDTSQEAEFQRIRNGVISGKLYLPIGVSINHETMTAVDGDSNEWEILGPPVKAARATGQWVSVRRQVAS